MPPTILIIMSDNKILFVFATAIAVCAAYCESCGSSTLARALYLCALAGFGVSLYQSLKGCSNER